MNQKIIFSILIPSIPSRLQQFLIPLIQKLEKQIRGRDDVEILTLLDNKQRSIGEKRDDLVQLAKGTYLAFVDDDDDVSDDYIESICSAILNNSDIDVFVFKQQASVNGSAFIVDFDIRHSNEQAEIDIEGKYKNINRLPFHICIWKSEIAKSERFFHCSYGEDWDWCKRLIPKVVNQHRIEKCLHFYKFDDSVTEASLTFPQR